MIICISEGTTRLALRVKEFGTQRQLTDWRMLQLLIQPPHGDPYCCNGSPWFLYGCWPMHPTGVDVANPRPDFPTICYNAYELDGDGRVVFRIDHRMYELPHGRYTGILRVYPHGKLPVNLKCVQDVGRKKAPAGVVIPPEFQSGTQSCIKTEPWPEPHPHPECCVLTEFDIDFGPLCSDHIVDQVAVDFALTNCTGEL